MTQFKDFWNENRLLIAVGILCLIVYITADQIRAWRDSNQLEYMAGRFPIVKAEERAICARELSERDTSMAALNLQVQKTNELAAYTLRFLGDRARVNDKNAAVVKQSAAEAAQAARDAKQTAEQIKQKVDVAATKATDAASAASAANKKLDTATRGTAAVPPQPWAGKRP